ncbi:APC family permease [Polymorphobacter sp.]|uniref:APC family permease n=1 Tax=Polymorphobacter sp. TaxID=1909290 RepID=UPI003F707406
MTESSPKGPANSPRQTLRAYEVLALTIGVVIGAGIFRSPSLVAGNAGSVDVMLLAWVVGGLLSIIGALCYAEMASAFPDVGGDYHFLERAYGRRLAFLYGWARLSVIQTGSVALLAYVVGDYLSVIAPLGPLSSTVYAALTVLLVCALNWTGVRIGAQAQWWLTLIVVIGLVVVIIAGLLVAPAAPGDAPATTSGSSAIGMMMVFVLLTYGGWSETVYVTAELKGSPRRMGMIMVTGLLIVTVIYLLANLAFVRALGMAGMAGSDAVAADVMRAAWGAPGAALISLAIALAALTSANATVITGARSSYALGRDVPALGWLGRWTSGRDTPGNAIIAQGGVALLLVAGGAFARDGFALAVDYTAPVFWTFLLLVGVGLFVLRYREPDAPRPFRVPLYPVLPAIFCLTCIYMLWSSVVYTGVGALVGIAVLVVGGVMLLVLQPPSREEKSS